MKKITLSLVSILALSTFSFAGGDIVPAEVEAVPVAVSDAAFYGGLGLGKAYINNDFVSEEISATALTLMAGYAYNTYVGLEGRYTFGFNTEYDPGTTDNLPGDYNGDYSSWGLYIKPMYPIGNFNVYALLGYGGVQLESLEHGDAYESGFQWGLGAGYDFESGIGVFVDYTSLYSGTGFDYRAQEQDVDADAFTIGILYKF